MSDAIRGLIAGMEMYNAVTLAKHQESYKNDPMFKATYDFIEKTITDAKAELAALETHKQIIMDMLSDMRSVDVYNSDWEILRRIKAAGIEHKALDVLGEGE